jgi:hypothetical protein
MWRQWRQHVCNDDDIKNLALPSPPWMQLPNCQQTSRHAKRPSPEHVFIPESWFLLDKGVSSKLYSSWHSIYYSKITRKYPPRSWSLHDAPEAVPHQPDSKSLELPRPTTVAPAPALPTQHYATLRSSEKTSRSLLAPSRTNPGTLLSPRTLPRAEKLKGKSPIGY